MASTPNLVASVVDKISKNIPKNVGAAPIDSDPEKDRFRVLLYGYTNSMKTTTAALFGGPERTLIVSTRDPEQIRIPLRGMGFKPMVLTYEGDALLWALQFPEKAADNVGFPEWKDREDRVIMVDDWTEGASLLVDDNSVKDDGVTEVKDGRKIYGNTKADVREVLNNLKKKHIHQVFTALADENDWGIWPQLPKGARRGLEAAFDYVFFMDGEHKRMITQDKFSVPYPTKDEVTGKTVTRMRVGFAKSKINKLCVGRTPSVLQKEEAMDLNMVWDKIKAAGASAK